MNYKDKINLGLIISVVIALLIIFIVFFNLYSQISPSTPREFNYTNLTYSSENIEIYILPNQKALDRIFEVIRDANSEVHCAFRSLNYEELEDLFIEKEKEINVRLFVNRDYMGNRRIYLPFVRFEERDGLGMMHNNYCIIDREIVITGSLIFNKNTIHNNIHDILIINSAELASKFNSDFWKIYNRDELEKKDFSLDIVKINEDTPMRVHFCPVENCETMLLNEFEKAKEEINISVYSFTNREFIKFFEDFEKKLKIILEPYGITPNSVLFNRKIDVDMVHMKQNLHTKLITIDSKRTITGTANLSFYGMFHNEETILVIENEEITQFYNELIEYLSTKTKN